MRLRQRGFNQLEDRLLKSYLDVINFEASNPDIVILNQLSAIKNIANRKAFSISELQISVIHRRFQNMYNQRLNHNRGELVPNFQSLPPRKEAREEHAFHDCHEQLP